jgi:thiosulfate dehydrogenase [quinone] large subunit
MAQRAIKTPEKVTTHRMPLGMPSRFWALSEWSLVPLRAFLGVTFIVAGLQKVANPDFFSAKSPSGIHAQMLGAVRLSPIGGIMRHLVEHSTQIGWMIAIGEIAVGVGTLLGLWTRVAAIGGALLSLSLFLAVSYNTSPYYTGADIVFLFAWLPLVVAGGGSRLSIDGRLRTSSARALGQPDSSLVAMPFAQVQALCGHYQNGRCRAQSGAPCDPDGCPVLEGPRPSMPARGGLDEVDRRTIVKGGVVAALAAAASLALTAVVAIIGRAARPAGSQGSTGSTTTTTQPGGLPGTPVAQASDVPVGTSVAITLPSTGDPGIIVQTAPGNFVGYDSICPHAGCLVTYSGAANLFVCPCHQSKFNVDTGDVISGPAPTGLTPVTITQSKNGGLYVT